MDDLIVGVFRAHSAISWPAKICI